MNSEIINARIEDTESEIKQIEKVVNILNEISKSYPIAKDKINHLIKDLNGELEYNEFYLTELNTDRENFCFID